MHSSEGRTSWGCAPLGQRGNVVYLVESGNRSYVKISGQRASARYSATESGQEWVFGNNRIVLDPDGLAHYFEGAGSETTKARFRCKKSGQS
ncbi:MAG: hypothetical protein QF921_11670 [Pseudomonadales bacterium]|nr:hypothetical protein [Pseudomonadales bacterium]MDP6470746.1 hypothetical protein [Pseudomonadales bacterium]MDP6828302.1 hypothetical protein [Pseudomonadales bacterium]MDP6972148.1 hypothetical protein [Pseudomonadales bacterium]